MKEDGKIYYDVVDICFNELHHIVGKYLDEGYDDEAFHASLFLLGSNIITWARTYNVNVEQFMQHTFDQVGSIVESLEKKVKSD